MPHMIVGRWGRNLAVRLPADVARDAGIADGERVEVPQEDGGVLIRKVGPATAEGLFRGRTPEAWRRLYDGAYDWGPDRGAAST